MTQDKDLLQHSISLCFTFLLLSLTCLSVTSTMRFSHKLLLKPFSHSVEKMITDILPNSICSQTLLWCSEGIPQSYYQRKGKHHFWLLWMLVCASQVCKLSNFVFSLQILDKKLNYTQCINVWLCDLQLIYIQVWVDMYISNKYPLAYY